MQYTFGSPGVRDITVTAIDKSGRTRLSSFGINVQNDAPVATIKKPLAGAVIYQDTLTVLQGSIYDPNEIGFSCNQLTWLDSNPNDSFTSASGCQLTASFSSPGPRTLTLRA